MRPDRRGPGADGRRPRDLRHHQRPDLRRQPDARQGLRRGPRRHDRGRGGGRPDPRRGRDDRRRRRDAAAGPDRRPRPHLGRRAGAGSRLRRHQHARHVHLCGLRPLHAERAGAARRRSRPRRPLQRRDPGDRAGRTRHPVRPAGADAHQARGGPGQGGCPHRRGLGLHQDRVRGRLGLRPGEAGARPCDHRRPDRGGPPPRQARGDPRQHRGEGPAGDRGRCRRPRPPLHGQGAGRGVRPPRGGEEGLRRPHPGGAGEHERSRRAAGPWSGTRA